jgi:peroxiredoxin
MTGSQSPAWMSLVLKLAGIYNLVWGAAVVLLPTWTSSLAGFNPAPRYPELWQCIGMIVGVYGVGYWIAASNPVRHWPIVLVGLLGKIFGPIGLLFSLFKETLPIQMIGTCLFNDLIWWIPFGMILWHAARESSRIVPKELGGKPSETVKDQNGVTISEHSRSGDFLVVFLRHSGCTFCREAIADVVANKTELDAKGISVGFVHMGDKDSIGRFEAAGATEYPRFSDPDRTLYEEFELELGTFGQLFGPATFVRGFRAALLDGHGFGGLEGNGLQMPGAFLVRDGEIVNAYRHTTASDRPDYLELCSP